MLYAQVLPDMRPRKPVQHEFLGVNESLFMPTSLSPYHIQLKIIMQRHAKTAADSLAIIGSFMLKTYLSQGKNASA